MSIEKFYTQDIILLTETTSTSDYMDTSTGGDFTTASSVKASVSILSGSEIFKYDQLGIDAQYKANAAVSTAIYSGRRCRWGGDTYVIVSEPNDVLQKGHHVSFLLGGVGNA